MADNDQPLNRQNEDNAGDDNMDILSTNSMETILSNTVDNSNIQMVENDENSNMKNKNALPIDKLNLPTIDNGFTNYL